MSNGVRVLREHDDLSGTDFDYHEWWVPGGKIYRNPGAISASTWGWHVIRCNNTDCRGEAIIRNDVFTAAVAALLPPLPSTEPSEGQ